MTKRRTKVAGIALALALLAGPARAQDSQYWTHQYGTQAQLLGGAVVGRAVDLSSTYYNPAALVLIQTDPGVVLTTDAFQYRVIKVKDASGTVRDDLTSSRFSPRPSIFTGTLPSGWLPGQLAFSFLTRMDVDLRVDNRVNNTYDVLPGVPGDEFFTGEALFLQELTDAWYGLTWADSVNAHVAFGLTTYVTYHGQNTRTQVLGAATPVGGGDGASATYIDEFHYYKYGMALKFGLALDYRPLTVGVTLTTPRMQLFLGDGKIVFNRSLVGLDIDGNGSADSDIAADFQEKLDPTFKFPLSGAVGVSYDIDDFVIHTTAEYFAKIDGYTVLDGKPVTSQNFGTTFPTRIFDARKEVLNLGIGVEYKQRPELSYFGSFLTDRSAHPGSENTNHTVATWDMYHLVGGLSGTIAHFQLTLGTGFTWGSAPIGSGLDLSGADESTGLRGRAEGLSVHYRNFSFLVGFSF
jgi:hypothetical protein